jgi:uncharacterized membrane-anchored protein YhcB (DUF1043 family)
MIMWKLILMGLIVWLAVYIFKRHISEKVNQLNQQKINEKNTKNNDNIEKMVKCTTCAVHFPRSEAFLLERKFYCCKAHFPKNEYL